MDKIYVVIMDVGEWSDHQTSVVCAYSSEELAQNKVLELESLAKREAVAKRKDSEFDSKFRSFEDAYCDKHPQPLSRDYFPPDYDKIMEKWYEDFNTASEEHMSKLIETSDASEFDETKDRYYDYPYYRYEQIDFDKE